MAASLRFRDSDPSDGVPVMLDAAVSVAGDFETGEQRAVFALRAHSLTCCPCGQDHSVELVAFKSVLTSVTTAATLNVAEVAQYAAVGAPESATVTIAGDVAGGTGSTTVLNIGDSIISQIESSGDQDWFRVNLVAGVTYSFALNGTGGDALSDPYLEIMSSSGSQLKFDDDGGPGLGSLLRFTPTASGTYFVNAHGWIDGNGNTSTGTYTLTATQAPPLPTYSVAQIADYLVNEGSSGGRYWAQTNLTYNIDALTAAQQVLAERALSLWAAVTPLTFTRTTGTGNLTFRNTDPNPDPADPTAQAAFAQNTFSGSGFITASTIVITSNWFSSDTTYDSYTQQTYIHEIGHALGLGHAGPYNGTAEWGTDNIYSNDNWAQTVMSYFDQLESGHGSYRFVLGLQQADIAAIQMLYGSNPAGTHAGNTTFGFNSSAPGTNIDWSQFIVVQPEGTYVRPPSMTVYDTGGTDTIDLSGFAQPQILSLVPGTYSSLGDRPVATQVNYANVISIQASTIIENAIGGSGNDSITGNEASNVINGRTGNDSIAGLGGDDRLNGGDGVDLIGISGNIYRLYTGTLGREPDVDSHRTLISLIETGAATFTQMIEYIISSPEFEARYGQPSNAQFVTLLYNNVLGRDPDPAGFNAWLNALNTGFSRVSLVSAFTDSPESIDRTLMSSQSYALNVMHGGIEGSIFRLYQSTLDRTPDAAGFTGWVNYIQTEQASFSDVILGFIGSAEFVSRYGGLNNTQFVTLLYNNVLNRAPDAAGLQGWVNYLNGGHTRAEVVNAFSESAENIGNTNSSFINFMRSADLGWQDTLYAGNGNDALFGGRGTDTFVVNNAETGTKTVYGLQPYDYVHLQGFGSIGQFSAALTQQGADAVFTLGGLVVRFVNTAVSTVLSTLQLGASAEVDDGTSALQFASDGSGSGAGTPSAAEPAPDMTGFGYAALTSVDTFDFGPLMASSPGDDAGAPVVSLIGLFPPALEPDPPSDLIDAPADTFLVLPDTDQNGLPASFDWA